MAKEKTSDDVSANPGAPTFKSHSQVLEEHRASVIYSDADCCGGHAITFGVGVDGRFDDKPELRG